MKTNILTYTPTQLRKAADMLERIEAQRNEVTAMLTGKTTKFAGKAPKGNRSKRTPEQRAAISAGLKAKWAAKKGASPTPASASTTAPASV